MWSTGVCVIDDDKKLRWNDDENDDDVNNDDDGGGGGGDADADNWHTTSVASTLWLPYILLGFRQ